MAAECVVPVKHGRGFVLVWACFTGDPIDDLHHTCRNDRALPTRPATLCLVDLVVMTIGPPIIQRTPEKGEGRRKKESNVPAQSNL